MKPIKTVEDLKKFVDGLASADSAGLPIFVDVRLDDHTATLPVDSFLFQKDEKEAKLILYTRDR
jgi:hypothetical protein